MKRRELYYDDDSSKTHIGTIHYNASIEDVNKVLNSVVDNGDGRSDWCWIRLNNGDLVLAVFPQGDTYMEIADRLGI